MFHHLFYLWSIGSKVKGYTQLLPEPLHISEIVIRIYGGLFYGILDGADYVRIIGGNVWIQVEGSHPNNDSIPLLRPSAVEYVKNLHDHDPVLQRLLTSVEPVRGEHARYQISIKETDRLLITELSKALAEIAGQDILPPWDLIPLQLAVLERFRPR